MALLICLVIAVVAAALVLRCLTYAEAPASAGLDEGEVLALNTERVVRLVGEWSLDPTLLDGRVLEAKGIAGVRVPAKFH